jgi:hypothetical protein
MWHHEGLYHSERNTFLDHVSNERVAQIMEAKPREACVVGERVPSSVPILLVLVGIIAQLAFVLPVRNAGKMFGHEVMFGLLGWWFQIRCAHHKACGRFGRVTIQFNSTGAGIGLGVGPADLKPAIFQV